MAAGCINEYFMKNCPWRNFPKWFQLQNSFPLFRYLEKISTSLSQQQSSLAFRPRPQNFLLSEKMPTACKLLSWRNNHSNKPSKMFPTQILPWSSSRQFFLSLSWNSDYRLDDNLKRSGRSRTKWPSALRIGPRRPSTCAFRLQSTPHGELTSTWHWLPSHIWPLHFWNTDSQQWHRPWKCRHKMA